MKKSLSDWRRPAVLGILYFGLLAAFTAATELKQDTIEAFDRYVKITEEERAAELRKFGTSLWIDRQGEARRQQLNMSCPSTTIADYFGGWIWTGAARKKKEEFSCQSN